MQNQRKMQPKHVSLHVVQFNWPYVTSVCVTRYLPLIYVHTWNEGVGGSSRPIFRDLLSRRDGLGTDPPYYLSASQELDPDVEICVLSEPPLPGSPCPRPIVNPGRLPLPLGAITDCPVCQFDY